MPYNNYGRRSYSTRRPYRKAYRKSTAFKKKPIAINTVKKIAKSVHYKQMETKWKGHESTWQLVPTSAAPASSFHADAVYPLDRGDNNQSRTGRIIKSLSVQNKLALGSNYKNPMWVRVLLLETKNSQLEPVYNNVLIDLVTKDTIAPTLSQKDLNLKINTDLYRVYMDKKIFLYGNGAQPDGWTKHSKNLNLYKRRPTQLTWSDDVSQPPLALPIRKNLFWVYLVCYPENETIPAQPPLEEYVNFNSQYFHYFKDM